jgi:RNA polymerase sigma-70 factor (ECF subfamily)
MSCFTAEMRLCMPTDEDLMVSAAGGNTAAFGRLIERHQHSAWSAAYRFLGDSNEAEDVAQEAFLKILDAAPRYRPSATFRTYLYRVVTRLCLDRVSKKKPFYTQTIPNVATRDTSPLEILSERERGQMVREALDYLPAKQRVVVVLRYYEGLNYAEIASALETTVKAVERLLSRARQGLEQRLERFIEP